MAKHENISMATLAVMRDVSYVQKEEKKGINYTIKSEEAVLDALRPAMLEHGIIMYPVDVRDYHHLIFEAGKYKNQWNRLVATHVYRFEHAESGTYRDVAVIGDGADTGDKAGNKSMTTSKKYALLEFFLLRTGDDPDETPSPKDEPNQKIPVDRKKPRMWTMEQKQAIVDAGHAQHVAQAKNMLDLSIMPVTVSAKVAVAWSGYYRKYRDGGKGKESACMYADAKYLEWKKGQK